MMLLKEAVNGSDDLLYQYRFDYVIKERMLISEE